MNIPIIQTKLLSYQCQTVDDQQNALKEIVQEIALMSLSRAGFFHAAAFQGGTCLRILYGLERFSEDLDFILDEPNLKFTWDTYIKNMQEDFKAYGFSIELQQKSKLDKAVKTTFLKTESAVGILVIKDIRTNIPKLNIKLEVDFNPPKGSAIEIKYCDFPLPFSVKTQDLPSLFAGKCHALLCRKHLKGRDWYDFIWYISRETSINLVLLTNAINQTGPWQNQNINVTKEWLLAQFNKRIKEIDWGVAIQDVSRFLKAHEQSTLELWSEDFFLSRIEKLSRYLKNL